MAKTLAAFLTTPFLIKFLPFIIEPFFQAEQEQTFRTESWENKYDYIIGELMKFVE